MMGLIMFATIFFAFDGYQKAGAMGALTGIVATLAIGSNVIIARAGPASSVIAAKGPARTAQRIGGAAGAVLTLLGATLAGMRWGWLGALAGYACGIAVTAILAGISSRAQAVLPVPVGVPQRPLRDEPKRLV